MFKTKVFAAASAAMIAMVPAVAPAANATAQGQGNAQAIATMDNFTVAQVRSYLDVIAQLESSGYTLDKVEKTFLGRMKITARNRVHLRELVVSRSTGEIMRDAVIEVFASADGSAGGAGEAPTTTTEDDSGSGGSLSLGAGGAADVEIGGGSVGVDVGIDGGLSIGN